MPVMLYFLYTRIYEKRTRFMQKVLLSDSLPGETGHMNSVQKVVNKDKSLKEVAYDFIKGKIASCEYPPNAVISEEKIREELGSSRTPIREALAELRKEELITVIPKVGIVITGLTVSDINMVFEARLLLEPFALTHYGNLIPKQTILDLKEEVEASAASSGDSKEKMYEADNHFHTTIMEAMPNRFLGTAYAQLHTQMVRYQILAGQALHGRLEETAKEHLAVLDCCIADNWEGAAQAMSAHLQKGKNAVFAMLYNYQDGGVSL